MNTLKGHSSWVTSLFVVWGLFLWVGSVNAGVSVYAEGAYTDSDLVVYVYADIDSEALCSAGVKVTYNSAVLSPASAEKNGAVWYMGDGTNNYPYKDPEDTGDGIVILCGKLDVNAPAAGVIGERILLGKIIFNRTDDGATPVSNPEDYFGISLALGYGGDFANFVTVSGTELDDSADFSTYGVVVRERGDANADSQINVQDISSVGYVISHGAKVPPEPWKDCNGDETINVQDISCIGYAISH
jgi:hypothetical protein